MRWLLPILIIVFAGLQYRLWFGEANLPSVWALQNSIDAETRQLDKLQARNRALLAEVKDLRAGGAAIEERARTELGMIRRGETFFLLPEESP